MTIPAGWYDDGSGAKRWWDGSGWTQHVSASTSVAEGESTHSLGGTDDSPAVSDSPAVRVSPVSPVETADAAAFVPPFTPPSSGGLAAYASFPSPTPTPNPTSPSSPVFPTAPAHGAGAFAGASSSQHPFPPQGLPPHAPSAPTTGVPGLGIAGLAAALVGAVVACLPPVSLVGWAVLAIGLVLSVVSLFLRRRKWAGISGIGVAVFGALTAGALGLLLSVGGTAGPIVESGSSPDDTSIGSDDADPDASGPAGDGETIEVMDLGLGDCLPYIDDTVWELTLIPCDEPHDSEVYFVFSFPEDGEYPGDDAVTAEAISRCEAAFGEFVGQSYDESYDLDYYWFSPNKRSWDNANDRTVQCLIFSYDGDVTGSLKGSGAVTS